MEQTKQKQRVKASENITIRKNNRFAVTNGKIRFDLLKKYISFVVGKSYDGDSLPVKSFFLPKETLQGAEIPAHIIWKDIPFSFIRAEIPPCLEVEQLFNVTKEDWKKENFGFVVKEVEIEGYLGMVLQSRRLDVESFDVWIDFSFIKEDQITEKISGKIHLFRPEILVEDVPRVIEINFERNFVSPRIKIKNCGEGTAIVLVKILKDSETKRKLPKSIQEFRMQYYNDVKENFSVLEKEFPQYSEIISEYLRVVHPFLMKRKMEKKYLKKIEHMLEKILRVFETDEDFAKAFVEAVGAAYLKNIQLLTVFDDFLKYFNSIASRKVLIPDPLWVFPISKEPKKLSMEILTTDLLIGEYPPIRVPKIELIGDRPDEVPIYRLFEWG